MKVAILTLRLHKNYGGILQNYALNKVLTGLGHDVKTINIVWDIRPKGFHALMVYGKRILLSFLGRKKEIFYEKHLMEQDLLCNAELNRFKRTNIPLTEVFYVPGASMQQLNGRFDVFVVGSDQVWRPKYTRGIGKYFLDFLDDDKIIRFSYSASFGTSDNEYTYKQQEECGRLIRKFKGVSVRESSAIPLIKERLKWQVQPEQHIDPTFLLNKSHYLRFVHKNNRKGGLYNYILDTSNDKREVLEKISTSLNITPYTLLDCGLRNDSAQILHSMEDWLTAIANADFVFTDSFHGCVFSIIFNRPFLVYGNAERGKARFESLLGIFGLSDRYIDSSTDFSSDILTSTIDWNHVNEIINRERERSNDYFRRMLE